jgi:hypothetical protein
MARLLRLSEVRETAEGEQPPGYVLLRKGTLNLGLLSVLSLVALPPAFVFFAFVTGPLGGPIDLRDGEFSIQVDPVGLLLVLIVALVVLPVVHELVHGAVAALCGGKPVYGIYAAILLAPLMVLSIVGVALMPITPGILRGPLLAFLITNASGAVGDIASLTQLFRLPADALIADTSHGFEVYAREEA